MNAALPRPARFAVPVVLLASLALCAQGIRSHPALLHPAWASPGSSALLAVALAAAMVALWLVARRYRWPIAAPLLLAAATIAAMFASIGAVAVVLLQLAAAFCIGRRILPRAVDESPLLPAVVATAAGLAVLSLTIGVASFVRVNNPASYLALLVLPVVLGWRANASALRDVLHAALASAPPRGWVAGLQLLLGFSILVKLLAVLFPEVGQDALAMHLVIADVLKSEGRFHYDVTRSIWALMPMAGDWQFAIANMLGGEHAARLLNFAAELLVLACIFLGTARRWGPLAGSVAALAYATVPLTYLETTSLFVENFWTLWLTAALLAGLAALRREGGRRAAACAGLLLGTALAAKVTTVFAAPFFVVLAIGWILASRGEGLRKLGVFAATAAATGLLPYANAWWRSGNPVFPYMNQVFKSPFYDASQAFDNPLFASGFTWDALYRATFDSARYLEADPGALGVTLLVLLPAALLWALAESRFSRLAAACAVAFVALVFANLSYLRYILPILPVFAMLCGAMVASVAQAPALRHAVLAVAAACAAAGLFLTPAANYHQRAIGVPPFAGSKREQDYLLHWRPERQAARVIDAMGLRKVLWLGKPFIAQSNAEVALVSWHGGYAQAREFDALDSVEALARWVTAKRFDAIVVATDFNACERQFVCDFLDQDTTVAYENVQIALRTPKVSLLYTHEALANPGFDKDTSGWGGTGAYAAADGAVLVTALAPVSQAVPVVGGERYLLSVEGRCTADHAPFRRQVNWLDGAGTFLGTDIGVIACTDAYRANEAIVVAPPTAALAMVYATGHEPDKTAEITRVSFRTP